MNEIEPGIESRNLFPVHWILAFGFVLTLILFGDVIFGFKSVVPTGLLHQIQPWRSEFPELVNEPPQQYDQLFQFYPWASYFKYAIYSGSFPLWNPFNYLGTPFFANPQTALLFPLTWLHLLFPLHYSFNLVIAGKFLLALVGMGLWLRYLNLSPLAVLLGSSVFAVSMDTMVSLAYPYSTVSALFPLLLLATLRCAESPSSSRFVSLVTMIGLTVLAGQPQSALVAFLGAGILLVWTALRKGDHGWSAIKSYVIVLLAFLIAGGLTAVQTLPALEYSSDSGVSLGPRIAHTGLPNPPASLLTLLIPDFFGNPYVNNFWGFPGYQHSSFYSSIVAIFLIPFSYWGWRKDKCFFFPLILGITSVFLMLGLPPFESLYELPGFDLIKRNKLPFFLIFAVAELSARGADRFSEMIRKEEWKKIRITILSNSFPLLLIMIGAVAWFQDFLYQLDPNGIAIFNFYWTVIILLLAVVLACICARVPGLQPLFLVLILLDLGIRSFPLNPRNTEILEVPTPQILSKFDSSNARIYSMENIFQSNTNMLYRLQDVRGYDVMTPERLFRYMQRIDPGLGNYYQQVMRHDAESIHPQARMRQSLDKALERWSSPLEDYLKNDVFWSVKVDTIENQDLFDLLQVRYLLSSRRLQIDGYRPVEGAESTMRIYQNTNTSRTRLYYDWKTVSTNILDRMKKVDVEKTVLVESEIPAPGYPSDPSGSVVLEEESAHRVVVQVESTAESVLVLFDRFSPGWKALLDGADELKVFPAQYIFRGVYVPAGKHRIEFFYQPESVRIGAIITLISAAACFLVATWIRKKAPC
jgi:hypothetical protein